MIPYTDEELEEMAAARARGVLAGEPRTAWSREARETYEAFERQLAAAFVGIRDDVGRVSHRTMTSTVVRVIDDRPCDPLEPGDADWWSPEDDVGCS